MKLHIKNNQTQVKAKDTKAGYLYEMGGQVYLRFTHSPLLSDALRCVGRGDQIGFLNFGDANSPDQTVYSGHVDPETMMNYLGEANITN